MLNGYVRSVQQNQNIVFLFYLDKDQKPLPRYLNRKNEKLKSYLPKGIDLILLKSSRRERVTLTFWFLPMILNPMERLSAA